MKKTSRNLLLLFAILFISNRTVAQYKWSAGYRTGIELINLNINHRLDFKSDNLLWTNEVFINRRFGKHFEVETALRYDRKTYIDTFTFFDGPEGTTAQKLQANHISLHLTARYHIIIKPRYSIYAQIGTSVLKPIIATEVVRYNLFNKDPEFYSSTNGSRAVWLDKIAIGAGFNYNLSKQIYLSATLLTSYKTDGGMYIAQHGRYNDWLANGLIGFGYRF